MRARVFDYENTPGAASSLFTYVYGLYEHHSCIVGRKRSFEASYRCNARGKCGGTEARLSQTAAIQSPGGKLNSSFCQFPGQNWLNR